MARPVEPRQRWLVTFGRAPVEPERVGRAGLDAWTAALLNSGLPLTYTDPGSDRPRFTIGAPLAAAIEGRAELLDLALSERLPVWRIREALDPVMPDDHTLVGAEDLWLGAPPLPGRVAAADYHVELAGDVPLPAVADAARDLLRAGSIARVREKAGVARSYDLRPLLIDVRLADGPSAAIVTRTRIHPELGSGRPEEVVGALGEVLGRTLEIGHVVRERLLLLDDLAAVT